MRCWWLLLGASAHFLEDPNDQRLVEDLLERMTLEEKVGQLELLSRPWGDDFNGESAQWSQVLARARNGTLGAVFNGQGVAINRELQRVAVEESRLGIPLIFGADIWHGMWTIFPTPLAEAASWDVTLAEQTARASAVEATASGLMWTFSPMVDTARDQRWGRNGEGAGEDPVLGAALAAARVRGFQGPDLKAADSLASCLKHFAGYAGATAGLDYSESDVSEATLRDVFLPPFQAGIEAGALSVMSAFQAVDGVPATGNKWLLTDVLRSELGFKGFVVTDYNADGELVNHGYAANGSDAARLALNAGVDMSMHSEVFRHLPELVANGSVAMERVEDAARKVLGAKAAMGLLAEPYKTLDPAREWPQRQLEKLLEHDLLARRAVRQSLVLLKNAGHTLPLPKCCRRIAVIGWWADSLDSDGLGVIWGNRSGSVTLLQGLRSAVSGPLRHAQGSEADGPLEKGLEEATELARWADVVLLALGESSAMSGEGRSRTSLRLPRAQRALARAVRRAAPDTPQVVLLKNGRALELEGAVRRAEAILVTWFLGKMTGHGIADVVFGDHSPEGHLPITFPLKGGQQPLYYNRFSSGRPCNWGSFYTNCYHDVPNEALYSFGHGLSYSRVEYGLVGLSGDMPWHGPMTVSLNVSNTGPTAVHELVQLYVHDQVAMKVRPVRELKAFKKLWLEVNETKEVVFQLRRQQLEFAPPAHGAKQVSVEPGDFLLWVANSSSTGRPTRFRLAPLI